MLPHLTCLLSDSSLAPYLSFSDLRHILLCGVAELRPTPELVFRPFLCDSG
jgi:hypothetical protein